MARDDRFSQIRVISLGDICIHVYFPKICLLQESVRSGHAPACDRLVVTFKIHFLCVCGGGRGRGRVVCVCGGGGYIFVVILLCLHSKS